MMAKILSVLILGSILGYMIYSKSTKGTEYSSELYFGIGFLLFASIMQWSIYCMEGLWLTKKGLFL